MQCPWEVKANFEEKPICLDITDMVSLSQKSRASLIFWVHPYLVSPLFTGWIPRRAFWGTKTAWCCLRPSSQAFQCLLPLGPGLEPSRTAHGIQDSQTPCLYRIPAPQQTYKGTRTYAPLSSPHKVSSNIKDSFGPLTQKYKPYPVGDFGQMIRERCSDRRVGCGTGLLERVACILVPAPPLRKCF